jgi:hypothetical protein
MQSRYIVQRTTWMRSLTPSTQAVEINGSLQPLPPLGRIVVQGGDRIAYSKALAAVKDDLVCPL